MFQDVFSQLYVYYYVEIYSNLFLLFLHLIFVHVDMQNIRNTYRNMWLMYLVNVHLN